MKVLVIDDNEDICTCVKDFISSIPNIEVNTYNNPIEALKENFSDVSAVIVDLNMPEMKGTEFLEKIQKNNTEIKSIILSGSDIVPETTARIDHLLIKPQNMMDLIGILS